ncbi:MAG TPA: hypothetical protein VHS53_09075 [Mucilaginibacter sp.]|jgi:VIT1/CCC1 family predicted Fe2+/Mn2+ transporter|nr:hypothetical protein [Mucilaginibacter sp.]
METQSKPERKNLWFTLLFFFLGVALLKVSFLIIQQAVAVAVLVIGVVLIIIGLVIFWKNFRE